MNFGEMALMITGGKRTASVLTENEGIALEIHRSKFYKLMAENLLLGCEFERMAQERRIANSKPK